MRENCTYSLSGGRWLARKRATSDPTPAKQPNKSEQSPAEAVEGRPLTKENTRQPNPEFQDARPSICLMAWEMEQEVTFGFWLHAQQLQRAGL